MGGGLTASSRGHKPQTNLGKGGICLQRRWGKRGGGETGGEKYFFIHSYVFNTHDILQFVHNNKYVYTYCITIQTFNKIQLPVTQIQVLQSEYT